MQFVNNKYVTYGKFKKIMLYLWIAQYDYNISNNGLYKNINLR